ncbi:MAG: type III pantothenate kinase [Planctomycetota bacterium]|nr:type III pantothenate kinase [Planctomycetota bacterium]
MDAQRILTVDLGNSGGSAALLSQAPGAAPSVEVVGCWSVAEEEVRLTEFARAGRTTAAALSAVGALDREARVHRLLEDEGLVVAQRPDPGLELRLTGPETCGADRQYAARGALALERAGLARVIVVDVGTAMTVDAATREEDGTRTFLGGAIALGPGTHARALSDVGARLPEFDLEGPVAALGRSTPGALRAGVIVGLEGAAVELVRRIAGEAHGGLEGVAVHLTGGARHFVEARLAGEHGAALRVHPALVHLGLGQAAAEIR